MEAIKAIGLMMGASWASGVNLYATVVILGLSGRMEWATLPESMAPLMSWPVIGVAAFLYVIEFCADKFPAVDSLWDSVHTFIRPLGGAALAWMAVGESAPEFQVIALLIGSALSLQSHTTKMTARLAINTSPEPVTNSVASVTEDVIVAGLVTLAMTHPIWTGFVVVALVVGTVWLTVKLMKFFVKAVNGILRFVGLKKTESADNVSPTSA